jgi:16S rRNA (guanine527-N7)-methyltransferase
MSRDEDPPPPPPAAAEVFGAALGLAERYAVLLAGPGVERGLLGPAEAARIWDRHLVNCAVVAGLVPSPCSLIDLGAGAGLPGMVLAMLLPDVTVTMVEPMARRVAFLEECIQVLGIGNAEVRRGRAEDLAGQLEADVVTARAVAPLDRLAGLAVGLLKPGGLVLAIKGAGAEDEVRRARPTLARLGVRDVKVLHVGGDGVDAAATVVRFTAGRSRPGAVRPGAAGAVGAVGAGDRRPGARGRAGPAGGAPRRVPAVRGRGRRGPG